MALKRAHVDAAPVGMNSLYCRGCFNLRQVEACIDDESCCLYIMNYRRLFHLRLPAATDNHSNKIPIVDLDVGVLGRYFINILLCFCYRYTSTSRLLTELSLKYSHKIERGGGE